MAARCQQACCSAITGRWGNHFGFVEMELTADSPVHLVVKAGPLTLYRGKVVDAATGEPFSGVLRAVQAISTPADPCSLRRSVAATAHRGGSKCDGSLVGAHLSVARTEWQ